MNKNKKPKPRLSMKFLYKVLADFGTQPAKPQLSGLGQVRRYLELVEQQIKSAK